MHTTQLIAFIHEGSLQDIPERAKIIAEAPEMFKLFHLAYIEFDTRHESLLSKIRNCLARIDSS